MNRVPFQRKNHRARKCGQAYRAHQGGQVIVEYVLLLVIAVSFGYLLMSKLVSRDRENPGILTSKWQGLLKVVGDDIPDKHK